MTTDLSILERFLERLEQAVSRPQTAVDGDAIDRIRTGPPRTTAVRSVRDHESVRRFREELASGLIAADTANRLLAMLQDLIEELSAR